ncbi:MAG: hypothetical protein U0470_12255 [Anaerolineae bacterium]
MDARAWLGQPVTVHGRRALRGVIGMRPPHVLDAASRDVTPDLDALFVDVGLAEDDVRAAAAIGDAVTMRRSPIRLAGGRWSGKAVAGRPRWRRSSRSRAGSPALTMPATSCSRASRRADSATAAASRSAAGWPASRRTSWTTGRRDAAPSCSGRRRPGSAASRRRSPSAADLRSAGVRTSTRACTSAWSRRRAGWSCRTRSRRSPGSRRPRPACCR